jgi:protein-S-isoprenylcysteine O-methyltransferase Ste14
MEKLGSFIFKYRNIIFPIFIFLLVFSAKPFTVSEHLEYWIYVLGIAVALIGQAIRALTIGLAYIRRGGKDRKVFAKKLVTGGIFKHCRNPLYLGNIVIVTGLGIIANSAPFYFIGIPLFIFMYLAITKAEEKYLRDRFGEEYIEYCKNVNRFMPDLSGISKTIKSMTFNWQRLVVKEYGTTFSWILCAILIIMKNHLKSNSSHISKTAILVSSLSFVIAAIFYAVSRYLKKSGRWTGK